MRDSGRYTRSVIRLRSQWRGPRRYCTGLPEHRFRLVDKELA